MATASMRPYHTLNSESQSRQSRRAKKPGCKKDSGNGTARESSSAGWCCRWMPGARGLGVCTARPLLARAPRRAAVHGAPAWPANCDRATRWRGRRAPGGSASRSPRFHLWALAPGVARVGLQSRAGRPRSAKCSAAARPARPPPTTMTGPARWSEGRADASSAASGSRSTVTCQCAWAVEQGLRVQSRGGGQNAHAVILWQHHLPGGKGDNLSGSS